MSEIFTEKDIISKYTVDQAVSDGFIHKLGNSNHRVTDNLFCALQKENKTDISQTLNHILCELLPIAALGFKMYESGGIMKTNFKFKVGNYNHSKTIWYIPNELGGLTVMKPEDYQICLIQNTMMNY